MRKAMSKASTLREGKGNRQSSRGASPVGHKTKKPSLRLPSLRGGLPFWRPSRFFSFSRLSAGRFCRAYFRSFQEALSQVVTGFGQTLTTSTVIAVALAIPMVLMLLSENTQRLVSDWSETQVTFSVYVNPAAEPPALSYLQKQLNGRVELADVALISPDQALNVLSQDTHWGAVLNGMDENPLPSVFLVTVKDDFSSEPQLERLKVALQSFPIVDDAALDLQWVRRVKAWIELGRQFVTALAVLFAGGAFLVVGNTVRLLVEHRKDQIVVAKLVGATNAFVRRPLVLTGLLYGLIGGILACLLLSGGTLFLHEALGRILRLYERSGVDLFLTMQNALQLVAVGGLIGSLGAWLGATRHLRRMEP